MSILNGEEALGASRTYTKKEMHKVYKPAGTKTVAELTSSLLVAENLGNVYNAADSGVTTSDFVEGPGKPINAGDNIDIVDIGSGDTHVYKFDLYMGADLSSKADKVTNATSGNLAGLDSNGNLTDSGVSPTEEVTVEGNPVTFDSPFEQDAKSVVVSVKPIQDLHGYDHPWVGGAGKNKLNPDYKIAATNNITYYFGNPISLMAGTYTLSASSVVSGIYVNVDSVQTYYAYGAKKLTFTLDVDTDGIDFNFYNSSGISEDLQCQLEIGSSATSWEPYSNICPISGTNEVEIGVSDGESEPTTTTIPLPSTLYDADVDVTNGDADSRKGFAVFDGTDSTGWELKGTYGTSVRFDYSGLSLEPVIGSENSISNYLTLGIIGTNDLECFNFHAVNRSLQVQIHADRLASSDVSGLMGFFASKPLQVCYELATPTTLSFDPTDVELLEGTNVVSTNGEKVAVTYDRSLWQDIDDLKTDTEGKLDKSDVATIEGDTASKAYSVNEFMLRSDGFYKVTQPIAQNASITASNTTKTTVGEVLTALLNA